MSRGLGRMQRDILDTLDEAKAAALPYQGRSILLTHPEPGWVSHRGQRFRMDGDCYDLRASLRFLAHRAGQTYAPEAYVCGAFQSSFSRAARGLLARGLLTATNRGHSRHVRFVRRPPPPEPD